MGIRRRTARRLVAAVAGAIGLVVATPRTAHAPGTAPARGTRPDDPIGRQDDTLPQSDRTSTTSGGMPPHSGGSRRDTDA